MLVIIIIIVFVIGLVMFLSKLPEIKKAVKDGWKEGADKGKKH